MFNFEKFKVYQHSICLTPSIYVLLKTYPPEEKYAICDQIRRALISVSSNIAEGLSRRSPKEQAHFIGMSYASLMEVFSQLVVSKELRYITENQLTELRPQFEEIAKMLSGLRNKILEQQ